MIKMFINKRRSDINSVIEIIVFIFYFRERKIEFEKLVIMRK